MISLDLKLSRYLNFLGFEQDAYGFIESQECDSLLFSGLLGSCQRADVLIDFAYDPATNEWRRRPTSYPPCYDEADPANQEGVLSKTFQILSYKACFPLVPIKDIVKEVWYKGSTISRDMLVGLAWYAWYNKRLDISENIIKRAISHFGVMGRGDASRINIMPGLLSTFAWISYKLGGPSRPWLRWMPCDAGAKVTGFEAHLQVLHLMLHRDISGKMSNRGMKALAWQAERQPKNALFQAAVGKKDQALQLLGNTQLWPEDRLPTTLDRYEQWVFQRDYGPDWIGFDGGPEKTHSGADFIFLYSYLTGRMKR